MNTNNRTAEQAAQYQRALLFIRKHESTKYWVSSMEEKYTMDVPCMAAQVLVDFQKKETAHNPLEEQRFSEAEWTAMEDDRIKKFFTKEISAEVIALMKKNNRSDIELKEEWNKFWTGDKVAGDRIFDWFAHRMNYRK